MRTYAGSFAVAVSTVATEHPEPDNTMRYSAIALLRPKLHRGEEIYLNPQGHIDVRLHGLTSLGPRSRMHSMTQALVRRPLATGDGYSHVDVGSSWAPLTGDRDVDHRRLGNVHLQAEQSLRHRDLSLRPGLKADDKPRKKKALTPLLIALTFVLIFALPLGVMSTTLLLGTDISDFLYYSVITALALMLIMQVAEGVAALRAPKVPPPATGPAPRASAIIAAYMPNEAATIMETLDSFLAQEYSGGLQIILAYNTPVDLPIEPQLRALAAEHPNLLVMRIPDSKSKATNVNAALAAVDGEFIGIFDADHQPMPGAFERAWAWISNGAGIVQGHCVIRNGDESQVAKMIAIEFEQIYAVNHPGRAKMQGFGIFGGANGYWRSSLLRRVRFQSAYLTEDIDSSVRAVRLDTHIVNDPGLLSRELAPVDLSALWNQRMRWAQGWFQVSLRHGHAAIGDRHLTLNQRFGLFMLLGWREIFPWVAALMWPILLFAVLRDGHLPASPVILIIITIATAVSGPLQVLFAYRLAAPEIRTHKSWWWQYLAFSIFFYQEWKNLIVRVAHLKEFFRQEEWVVTPRGHVEQAQSAVRA